jgi:hypothetical protein
MSRASVLVGILLAALLASYVVLATAKGNTPRHPPLAMAGGGGIPGPWVLERVRLHAWDGTRQTLDARAARIEVRAKRAGIFTIPLLREARVSDLDARVSKTGGGVTRVRADRARIDPLRRSWLLEGNARVEGPDVQLTCSKLRWDPLMGPIASPRCHPATIRPGMTSPPSNGSDSPPGFRRNTASSAVSGTRGGFRSPDGER